MNFIHSAWFLNHFSLACFCWSNYFEHFCHIKHLFSSICSLKVCPKLLKLPEICEKTFHVSWSLGSWIRTLLSKCQICVQIFLHLKILIKVGKCCPKLVCCVHTSKVQVFFQFIENNLPVCLSWEVWHSLSTLHFFEIAIFYGYIG